MPQTGESLERPRLTSGRLLLIPLRPRDATEVFEAIDESRRTLRRWMPWVDRTETPDDTLEFIRRTRRSQGDLAWGIWLATPSQEPGKRPRGALLYCGNVGLHRLSIAQGSAMIGYWIRRRCERQGYATEASAAVLLWAFDKLGLARVEIAAATGNAASLRVIEKLGFKREGVLREVQKIPGRRGRLDWMLASLVRGDLARVRPRLVRYCRCAALS